MKKLKVFSLLAVFVLSSLLFMNCNKKDDPTSPEGNPPSETNTGIVVGTVRDINGNALSNVVISAAGKTVMTNNQGYFTLEGLNANDRLLINISGNGYVTTQKITAINVGESSYLNGVLSPMAPPQSFQSGTGGNIISQGVNFDLPGNGYVDPFGNSYNGTVNLTSTYFDPSADSYVDLFPGDFMGVTNSGGTEQPLESFGFFDAQLTSPDGTILDIAPGNQVNVTFPIASSLISNAPATIGLFYYDMNTGEWIEDGIATKVGNNYVGAVSHFTSWNYDRFYDVTFIEGRVVDANGNPIANARVEANGIDYTGLSYRNTGADGTFRLGVRPNSHVEIVAKKGGVTSSVITRNPTGVNQATENIGDIILAPPIGTIALTWGEIPEDIDSHFLIPAETGGGTGGHVYFGAEGSKTTYPYAELDTDDTNSFGPEIITVYRTFAGTYTYFVHNFSSVYCSTENQECDTYGFLTQSQATVNLVFGGSAYTFNVPSSNPDLKTVWRVFEIIVNDQGQISINQFNDFVNYSDLVGAKAPLSK